MFSFRKQVHEKSITWLTTIGYCHLQLLTLHLPQVARDGSAKPVEKTEYKWVPSTAVSDTWSACNQSIQNIVISIYIFIIWFRASKSPQKSHSLLPRLWKHPLHSSPCEAGRSTTLSEVYLLGNPQGARKQLINIVKTGVTNIRDGVIALLRDGDLHNFMPGPLGLLAPFQIIFSDLVNPMNRRNPWLGWKNGLWDYLFHTNLVISSGPISMIRLGMCWGVFASSIHNKIDLAFWTFLTPEADRDNLFCFLVKFSGVCPAPWQR